MTLTIAVLIPSEQAEEERGDMEKVKLDNKRILFNLLPAHVAQHFLMSNPRNMVRGSPTRVPYEPCVSSPPLAGDENYTDLLNHFAMSNLLFERARRAHACVLMKKTH